MFVPSFGRIEDLAATEKFFSKQPHPFMKQAAYELLAAADDNADVDLCILYEAATGKKWNSRNQNPRGFCFPAGTRVRMADGSVKRIERISLGDQVLTAEGNTGRVVKTFLRQEKECLYKVGLRGHYGLQLTPEHPWFTRRGYVETKDLVIGDEIAIPKYLPKSSKFLQTAAHVEYASKAFRNNGYRRRFNGATALGRTGVTVRITPVPEVIELTADAGRIFGLYLAEGSVCVSKVTWTFDDLERDTLAKELVELLKKEWDVDAHIQNRRSGAARVCIVNLYGRVWVQIFKSLFGHESGGKRLHSDVASGPEDFLKALLNGWLDGDGHERRKEVTGVTVSHDLALNMYDIANAIGLRPVITYMDPKLSHGVKTRQRRYDLTYATGGGLNVCNQDDKYMWRKVDSIAIQPYNGDVYNFEVEGDNSYVAESIAVHNCVGFGNAKMAGLSMAMMAGAGEITWPGADVAVEPVYGGMRYEVGYKLEGSSMYRGDDGGVGAWAVEWLLKWGVLLMQKYPQVDLSTYSERLCDYYGGHGIPDDLEPVAKEHPLTQAALCEDADVVWKLIGQLHPVVHCSNQGFRMSRNKDGTCSPSGSWAHCSSWSGRFTLKGGNRVIRYDNSWDGDESGSGYLGDPIVVDGANGPIHLNGNQFLVHMETVDDICKDGRETYGFTGPKGFTQRRPLFLI